MKGFTTSGEGTVYDFSPSACDLRLLRLRLKKNRAKRRQMRTSPPITPPIIGMVVEELGGELDKGEAAAVPVPVEEELPPETDVEEVTGI